MSESKSDALTTWLLFHVIVNTISRAFIISASRSWQIYHRCTRKTNMACKKSQSQIKTEKKSASAQRGSKGRTGFAPALLIHWYVDISSLLFRYLPMSRCDGNTTGYLIVWSLLDRLWRKVKGMTLTFPDRTLCCYSLHREYDSKSRVFTSFETEKGKTIT